MLFSLPSRLPLPPGSPPAGILATREHGPAPPSLTDFAAFSSFGSRALGTSEPGSRPCAAPYPRQAGKEIGVERRAAQREEEEALTHHLLRAGSAYENSRAPPRRSPSQSPCLIASLQEIRHCCVQEKEESQPQGNGQQAAN